MPCPILSRGSGVALAFLGGALFLAWEWVNVFVLRDLALRAPDALRTLEEAKGLNLYDFGAIIPLGLFTLGWIALAASTFRAWRALRRAAGLHPAIIQRG